MARFTRMMWATVGRMQSSTMMGSAACDQSERLTEGPPIVGPAVSDACREGAPCAKSYSVTTPMRSDCKVSELIHATSRSPNRVGSLSGSRPRDSAMLVDRTRQAQGVGP